MPMDARQLQIQSFKIKVMLTEAMIPIHPISRSLSLRLSLSL